MDIRIKYLQTHEHDTFCMFVFTFNILRIMFLILVFLYLF